MLENAVKKKSVTAKLEPQSLDRRIYKLEVLISTIMAKQIIREPDEYGDILTDFAKLHLHENTLFDDYDIDEQIVKAQEEDLIGPQKEIYEGIFEKFDASEGEALFTFVQNMQELTERIQNWKVRSEDELRKTIHIKANPLKQVMNA